MPEQEYIAREAMSNRIWVYTLRDHKGHAIVEVNSRHLLIDTGSPLSIARPGITLAGQPIPANEPRGCLSLGCLGTYIGLEIDAIVGMDLLSGLDMRIDTFENRLELTRGRFVTGEASADVRALRGLPVVPAHFKLQGPNPLVLDTGAPVSYLRPELLDGLTSQGEYTDFHPSYGEFTTPVYRRSFTINNRKFVLLFGLLPKVLEETLLPESIDGIIGSEILGVCKAVLSMRRGKLQFVTHRDGDIMRGPARHMH